MGVNDTVKLMHSGITRRLRAGVGRLLLLFLGSLLMALTPRMALAAGGENVHLEFTSSHLTYLFVSLAIGAISLITAFFLAKSILAKSPGNESMQEVGSAIKEGALAYLKKQVGTMSVFILALAVLLVVIFQSRIGLSLSIWTSVSFIGGVLASYIAGFAGMIMAVNANTRTAHAALTSPRQSLEVAFRSGAVAGLLTVGMGLVGATLIFLLARGDAMQLLVGFGLGGSLAALFMRVGGGIYTKAADVGADLVGKVEAGIPEDDPRNPATIADNVGDNVGDCAGMAADVFESYEVTLVAAIVLGAATAAVFDQATWMKLVLFALMARGVGIIASIIGVFSVRGSDDVDTDSLKPIRRSFAVSAVVAILGTVGLAYFMMGGMGDPIQTTQLTSLGKLSWDEAAQIREIRDGIATEAKKSPWEVTAQEIQSSAEGKALGLDTDEAMTSIQLALMAGAEKQPQPDELAGYAPINFNDANNKVLNYAVRSQSAEPGQAQPIVTLKEEFGGKNFFMFKLKITRPATTTPDGQEIPGSTEERWFPPTDEGYLDKQIAEAAKAPANLKVEKLERVPVEFYSNSEGKVAMAVDGKVPYPHRQFFGGNFTYGSYYTQSVDEIRAIDKARETDPMKSLPPDNPIAIAVADHTTVPWHLFFWAIFFGILMAFAIEQLTDYYVSTHKKPVREVAGLSTAGPAPMIITGFALAKESSVFSVFAIVIALVFPLLLFPEPTYGTFILSFYGIALVGLGLLTTTGYILAMDTFGPISDNAQGVFEMSKAGHGNERASKAVQRLDAAGNTTKALTKGFAIATAVVAAVALFHSYIEEAQLASAGLRLEMPEIFLGLLIGGAAPFLFSAFSINAVGRAAFFLINEVRRQFKADPGIMKGTSKPDYGKCVAIVTEAAQKELLGPGILAIALPMAVAFGFSIGKEPVLIGGVEYNLTGAQALGGFLAGAILSGQLMAVLLANAGGIWDNAKKLIEDGLYGGKGTEAHKAGVVCDTVGDPFKDTAGPALNPLIKVMNLVALLLAPVVIQVRSEAAQIGITVACVLALAFSIWWSKRGSMLDALVGSTEDADAIAPSAPVAPPAAKKRITVEDEPSSEEESSKE
ncbi:MAG: putative K(+)-stimulated pyrophosphate-energized sodium pump [Fimbriimonadaceae bacterium]|nr:putative K(+)-stimulated pyrophosphate-energized sodium pump [Fimbriimonadaceae bacterium]